MPDDSLPVSSVVMRARVNLRPEHKFLFAPTPETMYGEPQPGNWQEFCHTRNGQPCSLVAIESRNTKPFGQPVEEMADLVHSLLDALGGHRLKVRFADGIERSIKSDFLVSLE